MHFFVTKVKKGPADNSTLMQKEKWSKATDPSFLLFLVRNFFAFWAREMKNPAD